MTQSFSLSGFGLPYWLDLPRPNFGRLDGPAKADVAIVGSGIAGLKLARRLSLQGMTSIVLEAAQVGNGASGRNQGTINHNGTMGYGECIRDHGRAVAKRVWELGLENHRRIREQIDEYAVDCDYVREGSVTLIRRDLPGWEAGLGAAKKDAADLREDGFDVDWLEEREATEAGQGPVGIYAGALRHNADAQFHSGKYVVGLAKGIARLPGVRLCEGVRVRNISPLGTGVRVETGSFPVEAAAVVLATNALIPQFIPSLERAMRAERGQVFVTEPLPDRPCEGSFGTRLAWWREVVLPGPRYRLLFGGGRDRDEPDSLFPQYQPDGTPHPFLEAGGFSPSQAHQNRLNRQFGLLFPQYRGVGITHRWGGLQSFTADGFPIVGCLDPERRIYGLGGFSGHGNCYSDVGSEYLAGKLAGVRSPIEESFGREIEHLMAPHREGAKWPKWTSAYD